MPHLLFSRAEHPDLTYDDVFMVPYNPVFDRLSVLMTNDEKEKLEKLFTRFEEARDVAEKSLAAGNSTQSVQREALDTLKVYRSFVLELGEKYPDAAAVQSRDDVVFKPRDGFGNVPMVIANMNNVVGKRMLEAMHRVGGSAALPQDKSDTEMKSIIQHQQERSPQYPTPVTITPDMKVREFRTLLQKRGVDSAVVVDAHGIFVGVLTDSKSSIPDGIDEDRSVSDFFRTTDLVTAEEGISALDALRLMDQHHIHYLPILCKDKKVCGALTREAAAYLLRYAPHTDEQGKLSVLATIGALNKNPLDRVKFLVEMGIKGLILDTAHLDQGTLPYRNIERARSIIEQSRQKVLLVAGNVVTKDATRNVYAAGGDIAKVGVGPGAMCITRMETGVGRPQFSAVLDCAEEAELYGKHVWADGGIRYPRDVALALAAGASQVMVGSLFTGTYDSPPDFKEDAKGKYKKNYGMASRSASEGRQKGRLAQSVSEIFRANVGHRSEGLDEGKVYMKKGLERPDRIVHNMMDGVTSSMTYAGARNLEEFAKFAHVGLQTGSGFAEGQAKSIS